MFRSLSRNCGSHHPAWLRGRKVWEQAGLLLEPGKKVGKAQACFYMLPFLYSAHLQLPAAATMVARV